MGIYSGFDQRESKSFLLLRLVLKHFRRGLAGWLAMSAFWSMYLLTLYLCLEELVGEHFHSLSLKVNEEIMEIVKLEEKSMKCEKYLKRA